MNNQHLFPNSQIPESPTTIVVLVVPLNYGAVITDPSYESATEILRSYVTAGAYALEMVQLLDSLGYDV